MCKPEPDSALKYAAVPICIAVVAVIAGVMWLVANLWVLGVAAAILSVAAAGAYVLMRSLERFCTVKEWKVPVQQSRAALPRAMQRELARVKRPAIAAHRVVPGYVVSRAEEVLYDD